MAPHRLLAGGKAGGDVEQLVGVDWRAAPEFAHEVPAGRALEECVHDLGLGDARELSAMLGEASYEVPERLARLLGACAQVPGVPRAHVCALEVPHEGADQVVPVVDLTGRQVLESRPCRVCEVQRQVADDDLVGGGSAQLARQAVVVEPHTGTRLPCVLVDRRGLAEALRKAHRADLLAEHAGPGGSGVGE
jgi:hypothetical protein